ncbi:MAG: hypothetical protein ACI4JK_01115 [Oscillospiraceae bacterium]
MKPTKKDKVEGRIVSLDKISYRNAEKGIVDYSNAEIGIRVNRENADIYAFGTKFEEAKYVAFKLDYNNEATEVIFNDFTFAAERINDFNSEAFLSIDGVNLKISPKEPYCLDMRIVLMFEVPEVIVQITLYNASRFAPGLSGCHISIGVKDVNYINVLEGCAAMVSVINHDTINSAWDVLKEDPNLALLDHDVTE